MKADLVSNALLMALFRRQFPHDGRVRSDRGSQCCSGRYQKLLRGFHLIFSMSQKRYCWVNAVVDNFFHTFKVDCVLSEGIHTRERAGQVVVQYIDVDYNVTPLHSTFGYLTSNDFESAYAA